MDYDRTTRAWSSRVDRQLPMSPSLLALDIPVGGPQVGCSDRVEELDTVIVMGTPPPSTFGSVEDNGTPMPIC